MSRGMIEKKERRRLYAIEWRKKHPNYGKKYYKYKRKYTDSEMSVVVSQRNKLWWTNERKQESSQLRVGENNPNWKGGITPISKQKRRGWKYRQWRQQVLERDKHQCVFCGDNHDLEIDHIKPLSKYPELAYLVTNGRVLCKPCHKKTETYAGKTR